MNQRMTPGEAWEGFVGSQSTADFWAISMEQGARSYMEAATNYVNDIRTRWDPGVSEETWADLPDLLAAYLERQLGPVPFPGIDDRTAALAKAALHGASCPMCRNGFSDDDIRNALIITGENGDFVHNECWPEYPRRHEV